MEEMQTNAKYGVGAETSLPVDGEQHHAGTVHLPVLLVHFLSPTFAPPSYPSSLKRTPARSKAL
jgi:hypothetical protein